MRRVVCAPRIPSSKCDPTWRHGVRLAWAVVGNDNLLTEIHDMDMTTNSMDLAFPSIHPFLCSFGVPKVSNCRFQVFVQSHRECASIWLCAYRRTAPLSPYFPCAHASLPPYLVSPSSPVHLNSAQLIVPLFTPSTTPSPGHECGVCL